MQKKTIIDAILLAEYIAIRLSESSQLEIITTYACSSGRIDFPDPPIEVSGRTLRPTNVKIRTS